VSDTIRLEVPSSTSFLPVVRMVLGGAAARLDLPLDALEDLRLAVEELFCAALSCDPAERYGFTISLGPETITVAAGPFSSPELRSRLSKEADHDTFELTHLLSHMVRSLALEDGEGGFTVVVSEALSAGQTGSVGGPMPKGSHG
jgi:hypothetical protein